MMSHDLAKDLLKLPNLVIVDEDAEVTIFAVSLSDYESLSSGAKHQCVVFETEDLED